MGKHWRGEGVLGRCDCLGGEHSAHIQTKKKMGRLTTKFCLSFYGNTVGSGLGCPTSKAVVGYSVNVFLHFKAVGLHR
jgi:hypothetical protein